MESTEMLIAKAQEGETTAWNEICRRFKPLVKKTAGQSHLSALRDDATGEAWLALAEAVLKYQSGLGVPAAGYLAAAVRYRLWNRFKAARLCWQREVVTEQLPEHFGAGVEAEIELAWRQLEMAAAVKTLPKKQRSVITAVFWRGQTLSEAAKLLGISPQAASQLQKRALRRLKNALLGMYEGERG